MTGLVQIFLGVTVCSAAILTVAVISLGMAAALNSAADRLMEMWWRAQ